MQFLPNHPNMVRTLVTPTFCTIATRAACGLVAIVVSATALNAQPRITPVTSGVTPLLQSVHAAGDSVVWAAGHRGTVLRSRDAGRTWEKLPTPSGDSLEYRDVHGMGADTAWILSAGAGAKSRIYRTTDGGKQWALQFLNADTAAFYDCLSFGSPTSGVAFSDASGGRTNILQTSNGGAAWTLRPVSDVPAPLNGEGAFAASGQCVAHASPSHVVITTGSPGARLLSSHDGGRTWRADSTPFVRGAVAGLTGIAFATPQRAVAVAGDINALRTDTSSAVIGITNDAGRTWSMRPRPSQPGAIVSASWVPANGDRILVVASYGGASYSLDAGATWTRITDQVTTSVVAVGRTAILVGGTGRIWRIEF
ncbi:MAG: oxidoreductase [Gemmatimonadaceae bacterium]|nr:oxidoreductase [Gemmatimonadaceae bacterium]